MLYILDTPESGYHVRTKINAEMADLTLAIAINFESAGERLTKKCAGKQYIRCAFSEARADHRLIGSRVAGTLIRTGGKVLNIAGNSLVTFKLHGVTQEEINIVCFNVLQTVIEDVDGLSIRTGGQTGMDIAGAVAATALGIPTTVLMPRDFLQRTGDGIDICRDPTEVRAEIMGFAEKLKRR